MGLPDGRDRRNPTLVILGSRGIPARHGGFETFAEDLALHLVSEGWRVVVYCQRDGDEELPSEWRGVELRHFRGFVRGPLGTILFDLQSTLSSLHVQGLKLVLGYNTGFLVTLYSLLRQKVATNVDGIEFARSKYSRPASLWLRANEFLAMKFSQFIIADHPEIGRRCASLGYGSKVVVLPYGVRSPEPTAVPPEIDLPGEYALIVARPVPENQVLEMVQWYKNIDRTPPLVVVGPFEGSDEYSRAVFAHRCSKIRFIGPVYDRRVLATIRGRALVYLHGHSVGGTNPSLLEAMAAERPIIAHENVFNRWVLGDGGRFFADQSSFVSAIAEAVQRRNGDQICAKLSNRYQDNFTLSKSMMDYTAFLRRAEKA